MGEFERRAYAVFKGGGVAGLAHVGALSELEKHFQFAGYAGTSAGSLIALLAAAGLSAEQMQEALNGLELRSLIGPYRYLVRAMPVVLILGWICFVVWLAAWLFTHQRVPVVLESIFAVTSLLVTSLLTYLSVTLGLVPAKHLREFLISQVRKKIGDFDRHTTFDQFRKLGAKPLKVFATDLSGKSLQGFGGNPDDNRIPVVQAVLASAAFPLFFWPGRILGRCMTDGGIACNLPVFCFDAELENYRLPVIAFDLTWKEHAREGRLWIIDFLIRLLTTAVHSHDAIIEKLTTRVLRLKIAVPEEIDVMDFSLNQDRRNSLFLAGAQAAEEFLKSESVRPLAKQAGSDIQYVQAQHAPESLIVPLLRLFCREAEEQLGVPEPRACIFMPVSDSTRKIVYHTFAPDPEDQDKYLELTPGEGVTGIAWRIGKPMFGVLPGQGIDAEKAKIVRPDRRTAFCVPLFHPSVDRKNDLSPLGVMVLDSSATVEKLKWQYDATPITELAKRWAATIEKVLT